MMKQQQLPEQDIKRNIANLGSVWGGGGISDTLCVSTRDALY